MMGAGEAAFVVDEAAVASEFERDMDLAIKKGGVPTGRDLLYQAYQVEGKTVSIPQVRTRYKMNYDRSKDSIGVVCSLYKCDRCTAWHRGGVSTAWVAGAKGILVTNFHVISSASDKGALGVWFPDGRSYPVMEVLALDALQDIAVIRVDAENLVPLPIAPTVAVMDPISVISHPESRYYVYTQGVVSRFYLSAATSASLSDSQRGMRSEENIIHNDGESSKGATMPSNGEKGTEKVLRPSGKRRQMWMNITAEYARGSSGGPVFDASGRVVGMVSSTQSIQTEGRFRPENPQESNPGVFQMCIRNCVPLDALRAVLKFKPKSS